VSFISLIGSSALDQWWWMSGEEIAHFILALAKYDLEKGFTVPEITVTAKDNNGNVLLSTSFNNNQFAPSQNTLFFENIPSGVISFQADGNGEASIIFGTAYIPSDVPTEKIDHGIAIDRFIQAVDPVTYLPTGPNLFNGSIGQLVLTTIQIILRNYSGGVQIVDPYPGAFNPIEDYYVIPPSQSQSYLTWFYTTGAFSQKIFLKDKIVFYSKNVYPGTYTVQYYSIILSNGQFTYPPAVAYDIFHPEVMGSTEGNWIFTTIGYSTTKAVLNGGICLPWENREVPLDKLYPYLYPVTGNQPDSSNSKVGLGVGLFFFFLILFLVAGLVYKNRIEVLNLFKPKKEEIYTL